MRLLLKSSKKLKMSGTQHCDGFIMSLCSKDLPIAARS